MPQLHNREATCGINVSDMCTSHASRNVFKMSLSEGLTSKKLLNCHFAKDVWQERCVENRFLQWERFGQRINYSWCIVTCAVQCRHSRLEEQSIFSRLLTRCCTVYFMKHKSEVLDKFKEFEVTTSNDAGRAIATLRTDNGGEYLSSAFQHYLKEIGIRHELTVPHSPQ